MSEEQVSEKKPEILNIPFINEITISGRICTKPEKKETSNGTCVHFRLVQNNNSHKDDKSLFINITCWQKLANAVFNNMKIGSPIIVSGRLCNSSWSNAESKQLSSIFITANNISFLSKNDIFKD